MCPEKFHEMRLAVKSQRRHIVNGDTLGIMLLHIFQNHLDFLQRPGLIHRNLIFLTVGNQMKQKLKQEAFYRQLIPFRALFAEPVYAADAV